MSSERLVRPNKSHPIWTQWTLATERIECNRAYGIPFCHFPGPCQPHGGEHCRSSEMTSTWTKEEQYNQYTCLWDLKVSWSATHSKAHTDHGVGRPNVRPTEWNSNKSSMKNGGKWYQATMNQLWTKWNDCTLRLLQQAWGKPASPAPLWDTNGYQVHVGPGDEVQDTKLKAPVMSEVYQQHLKSKCIKLSGSNRWH